MDKQKLLTSPIRDQYGTDSGSSVAYQRIKGDHPGTAAVHVETQSTHSTNR